MCESPGGGTRGYKSEAIAAASNLRRETSVMVEVVVGKTFSRK